MAKESRNDRRVARHEESKKKSLLELLRSLDFAFSEVTRTFQFRLSTM